MFEIDFYREAKSIGDPYRKAYMDGIEKLMRKRNLEARAVRTEHVKEILAHPDAVRKEFKEMLGWPLTETYDTVPNVKKTFVTSGKGISVWRTEIEVLEGVPLYGLLFLRDGGGKRPLIIVQHGGEGTPEMCSGLYEDGTFNYNHITECVLAYDVNVFAPQLLLWKPENYPVISEKYYCKKNDQRQNFDFALKQLGGSMTALEVTCLCRALDYLCTESFVDTERIGMVGLSYGGHFTLFTAAADTRIRSAICSCYFANRELCTWSDFTYQNASYKMLDAEIALLVCPRKLWIQSGRKDVIFFFYDAEHEHERLREICGGTVPENITLFPFDGEHEFWPDQKTLDDFIASVSE